MRLDSVIQATTLSSLLAAAQGYGTTVSIPINYCPAVYGSPNGTPVPSALTGQYIFSVAQLIDNHKRQAGNSYIGAHGVVTQDPTQATIFKFTASGQLMSGSNYVSTSGTVVSQRFEVLSVTSSITGTFAIDSSRNLAWHNETFGGGYAIFCFNQDFIQINFNGQANQCFQVTLSPLAWSNNNGPTTSTKIASTSQMSSMSSYRSTTSATPHSSNTKIATTLSNLQVPETSSTTRSSTISIGSSSASLNFSSSRTASLTTSTATSVASPTSTAMVSIPTTSSISSLSTIPLATSQTTTSSAPTLVISSSVFSSATSTVTSRLPTAVTSSSNALQLTTTSSQSSSATGISSRSSSSTSNSPSSSSTTPLTSAATISLVPTSSPLVLTTLSSTPTTSSLTPSTTTVGYCQATPTTSSLCPAYDQQTLNVNDDGVCFEIECGIYLQGNELTGNATIASSLKACTSFCTLYNIAVPYGCVGVIYLNYQTYSPNNCYLYSSISGTTSLAGIDAARLIYPGYPFPADLVSSSTMLSSSTLPSSSTSTTTTTMSILPPTSTLGMTSSSVSSSTVITTSATGPTSTLTSPTTSSTIRTSSVSSTTIVLPTSSPQSSSSSSSSSSSAAPPLTTTTTTTTTSTTISTTSSSTTNCPSAPPDNSECPGNSTEPFCYYYSDGPANYEIECATQFSGPTLQQVYSQSLADCIFYCDYANSLNANSCLGVTYLDNPITQGGANNCFRYSSLTCATRGNATWDSARLLYSGYPAMTDYSNSSFTC